MTGLSHGANLAIGTKLPWSRYRSLMDVGTAQGDLVVQLALAHPHITGIGVDLPEVDAFVWPGPGVMPRPGEAVEAGNRRHVGGRQAAHGTDEEARRHRAPVVAGDLFADPLPAVTWS